MSQIQVDLGDTALLSITATDANGAAVNADAVTVTVTLPDGSTVTPAVTNPAVGSYQATYPTTVAGMLPVRWLGTGLNAFAHTDILNVAPSGPAGFLSMAEVKAQLNIVGTGSDDELRDYIATACDEVEQWVGPILRRQIVGEFVDLIGRTIYNELTTAGTRVIVLRNRPILTVDSITSALLSGVTYDPTAFVVEGETGIVRRNDGGTVYGPLRVTYTVGRPVVPPWARLAARIIVQHLWRSQRGPSMGRSGFGAQAQAADDSELVAGIGFMVPRMAAEILESHRLTPAVG